VNEADQDELCELPNPMRLGGFVQVTWAEGRITHAANAQLSPDDAAKVVQFIRTLTSTTH
jgi:hypothetical protein